MAAGAAMGCGKFALAVVGALVIVVVVTFLYYVGQV